MNPDPISAARVAPPAASTIDRASAKLRREKQASPSAPGIVRFDRRDERFHPAPLCGVAVPRFRAFRQYYSPLF